MDWISFGIALVIALLVFIVVKRINWKNIVMNTIAGFITLIILNALGFGIPITLLTLLLIALLGVVGLIIVLLLKFMGML